MNPDAADWKTILLRPSIENTAIKSTVNEILSKVKAQGDSALKELTLQYDQANVENIQVTDIEFEEAEILISKSLKKAIKIAAKNIKTFHKAQQEKIKKIETMPGITCWRESLPIEKVGLYIPGGTAPLISTLLMLGIPAKLAGCEEIIVCTPPGRNGKIDPAILFAASFLKIIKVFKVGGAQAIAAMAYGTESIPKVYKIFGPGNQYVTKAKEMVQVEGVAIDMPAGPSELAVFADKTCVPAFVAADLLSQCEHGKDSQVVLVCTDDIVLEEVITETKNQLVDLPRKDIAAASLANSSFVLMKKTKDCFDLLNAYAPEHLILASVKARELAKNVKNAGSIFLGNYAPESGGDYATGTNHTLPTNGAAFAYSGVSLDSFVKKITFQELTKAGLKNIAETVETLATAEGLQAHKNAVSIRFKANDK